MTYLQETIALCPLLVDFGTALTELLLSLAKNVVNIFLSRQVIS